MKDKIKLINALDAAQKAMTTKQRLAAELDGARERLKRSEQRFNELKEKTPTDFFRIRQAGDIVKAGRAVVDLYEEQMRAMESSKAN